MHSSLTSVKLRTVLVLLLRYSSPEQVACICSDNERPILIKYVLNLLAISSGSVIIPLFQTNSSGSSCLFSVGRFLDKSPSLFNSILIQVKGSLIIQHFGPFYITA